jgi:hypothetical protein
LRVDQAQCNDHLADYKSIWASQKKVSSDCVLMANKRGMISSLLLKDYKSIWASQK